MRAQLGWEDALGELRLLRQAVKHWLFVVEGITDSEVLRHVFNVAPERVVVAGTKSFVVEIAARSQDASCLYLVDKDYDGEPYESPIIATDYYDIENFLLRSPKLKIVVDRFCSAPKTANVNVLDEVDSVAGFFSRLRVAAIRCGKPIKLPPKLISELVLNAPPYIDFGQLKSKCLAQGYSNSDYDKLIADSGTIQFASGLSRNISSKIWIAVFSKFARGRFGSLSAQQAEVEHLQKVFAVAIDRQCFTGSGWLTSITASVPDFGV